MMVLTDLAPVFVRPLFFAPSAAVLNILGCRIFRQTLLDIAGIRSQISSIGNQDTIQFRFDVDLTDEFSANGMGAEGISSDLIDLA